MVIINCIVIIFEQTLILCKLKITSYLLEVILSLSLSLTATSKYTFASVNNKCSFEICNKFYIIV